MKKIDFKVTFISDIVLHSSSNTEGNIEVLDYITGSSFLGIIAKKYDEFENSFEVFHSGKVRFGEATPLIENKATYKVPFSFFKPKLDIDNSEVYNNHFVDYTDEKILDLQLKQLRNGYISSDLNYINLDYVYSQKSAYDIKTRKSKDSQMYGYKAIKRGTTWKFSITFDKVDEKTQNQIIENIIGTKYLGKSKTSQYGKVLIERFENFNEENIENLNPTTTTYIYINSSLCLFDKNSMPTYKPTPFNLGLSRATIDWEKTQIRTKTFTPFNYTRETNDYSRLVIEKGSVIAITNPSEEDISTLRNGLGAYLSEGYGEVLINPSFLLEKKSFKLNKKDITYVETKNISIKKDEVLLSFLANKDNSKKETYNLGKYVQKYIEQYKSKFEEVSNSQWGQIRMIVQFNENKDDYSEKILQFVTKKKDKKTPKKHWEEGFKTLKETLKDEDIDFIKLLSIMMPKVEKKDDK